MPATLYIYIDPSYTELSALYENQIASHNFAVMNDSHANSGFDLFFPQTVVIDTMNTVMVDFRIKCEMRYSDESPSAFYLYPRSSMSKTMLMLANHVGIIDSGYRGFIMAAFRFLGRQLQHTQESKGARLVQICAPDLKPFLVQRVMNEDVLSKTTRGTGGFGSSG